MAKTWIRLFYIFIVCLLTCFTFITPAISASDEAKTPVTVGSVQQINPYFSTQTTTYTDGTSITQDMISGPPQPPPGFEVQRQAVVLPEPNPAMATNTLTVPAFTWVFGCSAVSGSMIAGYYDRNGYPNMYTGPTDGGVMPLDNSSWGTWSDGVHTYRDIPLAASHNGVDGRVIKGSIDDYWVEYGSSAPDPYITSAWTQHTWGSAIGDYMKTSQSAYSNTDGETTFWNYTTSASPLTCAAMLSDGYSTTDGTYGRKLFYEARGYTVTDCYSQKTDNTIAGGFSFAQFKAEIDAGRPVMLNLAGHTIVGVGYKDPSTVYIHDTWDYLNHSMTWGGSYSGMQLLSVSIVNLAVTDTTPNAFTFEDQINVALNTPITSNAITVSGINTAASISIVGGTYSINGAAFTSESATVSNGNTVRVQQTSSGSYSTTTDTTLTIGGVSDTFSVTTLIDPADITPDQFTFTDQTNVALNTPITSNTITVLGIGSAVPISIVGGTYSINGAAFTNESATVNYGNAVRVRQTSSGNYSTTTNATLNISGVSDTFSVTTLIDPADITPDQFTFTDQTNVALNTPITSNTITVSGIGSATNISIVGGTYSINGAAFTSASGTVNNGNTVRVKKTSSAIFSTTKSATLVIGGVSDTFSVTTVAADTIPNPFNFTDQTNVALNTPITSNAITVSGINAAAPISIASGTYSINGAAFTSAGGTVSNGNTVRVKKTSASLYSTTKIATLTISGVFDTFSVTTLIDPADITPDPFAFEDQMNIDLNTPITSNAITISGLGSATNISIVGGTYSINGAAFTSAGGTVSNGNTVRVKKTSSTLCSTTKSATLTVGTVSDTFSVTTHSATTPDTFHFTDLTNVALNTPITSNAITVSGLISTAYISIAGGTYSINGAAFTSDSGTVSIGNIVTVQQTSSGSELTTTDATLTIGGVSDTFSVTTRETPAANTWTAMTDFGGLARYRAVGFSIGTKGYIGTGLDDDYVTHKDFWEYDPAANTWTQKADFGGSARYSAVGLSIGTKGYIGKGGSSGKDFWEYDPITNTWKAMADFEGTAGGGAVGFSIGTKGYIGASKDFWEYDPAVGVGGTWTKKADFGGVERCLAVGFSIGGKGYIGVGSDGVGSTFYKDFWEYDPAADTWTKKADFEGTARYMAVGFTIGTKGYIGTGHPGRAKDFWEYDPTANTWTPRADFGGAGRSGAVGFSIGTKGYIGTGQGGSYYKDLWEYNP